MEKSYDVTIYIQAWILETRFKNGPPIKLLKLQQGGKADLVFQKWSSEN